MNLPEVGALGSLLEGHQYLQEIEALLDLLVATEWKEICPILHQGSRGRFHPDLCPYLCSYLGGFACTNCML